MSRSFRIVADTALSPLVDALLAAEGFAAEPEPFSPLCRRLLAGPAPLGLSLAAFFGWIYIQDRSSMLPPLALAPASGAAVLDMAASPGSKTGFLAQLAGTAGLVLGNEPAPARLATLRANLHRCNLLQAATCSYPGEKLPLPHDKWPFILLDPPCSGWGTVDKHPKTVKIWRGAKIGKLLRIQKKLLAKAAALLAPGGRLLYSTCTTNPAENEEQTAYAREELGLVPMELEPFPGFVFQEFPGGGLLVDGEASSAQGFYLSLLRKKPDGDAYSTAESLEYCESPAAQVISPEVLAGPMFDPDRLPPGQIAIFGDKVRFLPAMRGGFIPAGLRWQGALLGKWQGGRFVPSPRARACLPQPDSRNALVFEEIEPIRRLLAGTSLETGIKGQCASIWWRDLPLGTCQVRNGRLAASWK